MQSRAAGGHTRSVAREDARVEGVAICAGGTSRVPGLGGACDGFLQLEWPRHLRADDRHKAVWLEMVREGGLGEPVERKSEDFSF
jgi:hypothetical protein